MESTKNILFIVEGKQGEKKLIKKLTKVMCMLENHEFFTYETNIYALKNQISKVYPNKKIKKIKELLTITDILIDIENEKGFFKSKSKMELLRKDYTDIFIVFDFDSHDPQYDEETLKFFSEIFDDEADRGMLYINFPMLESFRHILIDENNESNFFNHFISSPRKFSKKKSYKKLVDIETKKSVIYGQNLQKLNDCNDSIIKEVLYLHFKKAAKFLKITDTKLNATGLGQDYKKDLLIKQLNYLSNDDKIYCLSELPLIFYDRAPMKFIQNMNNFDKFSIKHKKDQN